MQEKDTQTFYDDEVRPSLKPLKGPVSTFELEAETMSAIKAHAIETGEIEPGVFSDIPLFEDITEREARQKAKTAKELLEILTSSDAFTSSPNDAAALLHAEGELAAASLVEGARMLKVATHEPQRHLDIYSREIDRAQEILYGSLDKELADASVAAIRGNIEPTNIAALELAQQYEEKYPWSLGLSGELPQLNEVKLREYNAMLRERFTPTFMMVRGEFDEITNENLVEATNRYLQLRGYADDGWTSEENPKRTGFFANAGRKVLESGKRTAAMTWPRFEELMMHEVEMHIAAGLNAQKAGAEPLSSTVLPGIADVEEGKGLLHETLWRGSTDPAKPSRDVYRYMAVAYADGLYDGEKHSEEETYAFVVDSMTLQAVKQKPEADIEKERATSRRVGFDHVYRIYRGMPAGQIFRRNAGYLLGVNKMTTVINESSATPDELFNYFQQAKTDPTNPQHDAMLKGYNLRTL